ncbi:MAG TPA: cell envelope integrity protein TolA [Stellaceae bacterium]
MSLALAEPAPTGAAEVPEEVAAGIGSRGIALSAALHIVLGGVLILGLPKLFDPPPPEEMPIAVQLVTIAPETRATHPNPNLPRPDAKPEVPEVETPAPKPEPKPEPTKPAPVPPSAPAVSAMPDQPTPDIKPPPPPKPPEPKPEVKPVEKVEVPKPKEKPEPPRQLAKVEPKPEEKKPEERKYDPRQFDALLKNLAPVQTAMTADAPPQTPRVASAHASSQPKAPLGSQLTASELDMVRHQIARCWNVPAGARDAKDLVVEIKVVVDPDGTVRQATIVDQGRFGDPSYRAAAESARRAFFNPLCRPLHLPAEKYAIWKDLVVDFSPRDIL